MKNLLALLLFVPRLLLAQNLFDGTWEVKVNTVQFAGPAEEYVMKDGAFDCLSCVPKIHVKADGSEQNATGQTTFDTISVRVVNNLSVEFGLKKGGKPIFACTETVSQDGNVMTQDFTETTGSEHVMAEATFTRVSKGPAGSHALSGAWQMETIRNFSNAGPAIIYEKTNDGVKAFADGLTFEARFDGKDYPVPADPTQMVSLRMIGDHTIEETYKLNEKVIRVVLRTVSKDGKEMRVVSSDKQKDATITYTAQKRSSVMFATPKANITTPDNSNRSAKTLPPREVEVNKGGAQGGAGSEYDVVQGDSLSKIAERRYGKQRWPPIYCSNSKKIKDPDLIFPGQSLHLPVTDIEFQSAKCRLPVNRQP